MKDRLVGSPFIEDRGAVPTQTTSDARGGLDHVAVSCEQLRLERCGKPASRDDAVVSLAGMNARARALSASSCD
ncbi:hypothetical protein A3J23_01610 [Candidatus Peregrinibacteria bacterium RIFCSPLOWO2_02_FULL_48_14]|nr:MAG: hypothetical protein A2974_03315 [Candidatus Peregrinibacteria bacterium RIFCSPLOWO2_01_FULL_48_20]OGJ45287.1 MAG: hypothetical protein A3J23_01610 [Candidatus Peregrinibacteria bacterium RIFCSPLOWO2_02_FULL_48_14]